MTSLPSPASPTLKPRSSGRPLCFLMDEDFVFRQDLAKELHRADIDVVQFSDSSRFLDMIEDQGPDVAFINLNNAAPRDCVRALLALRECTYSGAVQIFGRSDMKTLESFKAIGVDCGLTMLPPLQKPITVTALQSIIRQQRLHAATTPSDRISLTEALAKNLVRFLYQPKYDLRTKMIAGAEVMARVAHPEFGLLTPDQFLKGADEHDLLKLSHLALVSALQASADFHQMGAAWLLAINISVDSLLRLPIAELVSFHRPQCSNWVGLLLEVPERQIVNKIDVLKTYAAKLEQLRISLAIDNFGVGSPTLGILNEMLFAEIKIDRSLIQDCASNQGRANICKTLIQMAQNFGSQAAAVGISTEADLQILTRFGCDIGQGFCLGRPLTADEMKALVARPQV